MEEANGIFIDDRTTASTPSSMTVMKRTPHGVVEWEPAGRGEPGRG